MNRVLKFYLFYSLERSGDILLNDQKIVNSIDIEMKQRLPPLSPPKSETQQNQEPYTNMKTKMNFIKQASSSQTFTEFKGILSMLEQIFEKDDKQLSEVLLDVNKKRETYQNILNQYHKTEAQYNHFLRNTRFLSILKELDIAQLISKIKDKIQIAEVERKKIGGQPFRISFDKIYQDHIPPVQKYLHLIQYYYKSLENQVYLLNKRIFLIDSSDQDINHIKTKYGSLQQLYDYEQKMEAENQEMRIEEKRYFHDPFARRRTLTQLSDFHVNSISFCSREYLRNCLDRLLPSNESIVIDYDSICPDSIIDNNDDNSIQSFQNSFDQLKETYEKVRIDINKIPKVLNSFLSLQQNDSLRQYAEKINNSFSKYSNIRESIESKMDEISFITQTFQQINNEKKVYEHFYTSLKDKYNTLLSEHKNLQKKLYQNRQISNSLYHLSHGFGIHLIDTQKSIFQEHFASKSLRLIQKEEPTQVTDLSGFLTLPLNVKTQKKKKSIQPSNSSMKFSNELICHQDISQYQINLEYLLKIGEKIGYQNQSKYYSHFYSTQIFQSLKKEIDDLFIDFQNWKKTKIDII